MEYRFIAHGHKYILAEHRNTLEVTTERNLTKNGDCIVAVAADFEKEKLKQFFGRARMTFEVESTYENKVLKEYVDFDVNPDFDSDKEIVLRLGDFSSARTYGLNCTKSSKMLSREFIRELRDNKKR